MENVSQEQSEVNMKLEDLKPCEKGLTWARQFPTLQEAWEKCENSSWMFWLARKMKIKKVVFVRISCDISRTVLRFVPEGENRPRLAIEVAEKWCENPTSAVAADAAAAAADAYYATYADNAAYSAANAAAAAADAAAHATYADNAANAASNAANAALYAAYFTDSAYSAAAAHAAQKRLNCDIIRKHVPVCPLQETYGEES